VLCQDLETGRHTVAYSSLPGEGITAVVVHIILLVSCRFISTATEPDERDRSIVFTIFDGVFSDNDNITLEINTIDDNATIVSGLGPVLT